VNELKSKELEMPERFLRINFCEKGLLILHCVKFNSLSTFNPSY